MNGADALIFTAGIGEHSAPVRAGICADLDQLGIAVDAALNNAESHEARRIGNSPVAVWVIPTEEQLMIARDTVECIDRAPQHTKPWLLLACALIPVSSCAGATEIATRLER